MTSSNRLQLEKIQGTKGSYAMVVTCLIINILYIWFNIMTAYLHVEDMMMEQNKQDKEDALFNLVEVPSIYSDDQHQQNIFTQAKHRDLPPPPSYSRPQNIHV